MFLNHKRKWLYLIIVAILCLFSLWLLTNEQSKKTLIYMDNFLYDTILRYTPAEKIPDQTIVIIDIDDKSMSKEGRWPWPRKKIAHLLENLRQLGAIVIAFDMTFVDSEQNELQRILPLIKPKFTNSNDSIQDLHRLIMQYNPDQELADVLKVKNDVVLGFIFDNKGLVFKGKLPSPIVTLSEEQQEHVVIITMKGYQANIPLLQDAVKNSGFITVIPDSDGVIRRTPLILRYQNKLYPSLSLAAATLYFLSPAVSVEYQHIGEILAVDHIKIGSLQITTNEKGEVLLPNFPIRAFKHISAIDILQNQASAKLINNAIVLIGTTALGMSDFHAIPTAPVVPGIDIQALIFAGFLKGSFPTIPVWGKGFAFLSTLICAMIFFIFIPLLNFAGSIILFLMLLTLLLSTTTYLWITQHIFLPITIPFIFIVLSTFSYLLYSYFTEYRKRKQLKNIFGQYIPKSRVDELAESSGKLSLKGESKVLTVLFADIINFTELCEQMNATEVKEMLNQFFTPMTKIIFEHQGTIDKYVGDMLMAFWGAPVEDSQQKTHALQAALAMRDGQKDLQVKMGIGLNTGMMHVGDMGSQYRLSYTVLGDAVNLGARIEHLTRFYDVTIIASGSTKKSNGDFIFRFLDRIKVKGKKIPVEIYELICEKKEASSALRKELKQYETAISFYHNRDWEHAKKIFLKLNSQKPTRIYHIYLERIEEFLQHPPSKKWRGVVKFKFK